MKEHLKKIQKRLAPRWTNLWPEIVVKTESSPSIILGSGITDKLNNSVHVDINPLTKPDLVCDLNRVPYPFKSNTFEVVVALSILEHLEDFFGVMGEIHRISKHGASVYILVPHFSSAGLHVDPSHRQHLSIRSCDYFIEGSSIESDYGFYVPYRYRLVRQYIDLAGIFDIPPFLWFVRHNHRFWEEYLCYIIRGKGIFWELEVVK